MRSILIKTFVVILLWNVASSKVDVEVPEWKWCSSDCCNNADYARRVSLESVNMPGRYWRFCKNSLGLMDSDSIKPVFCEASTFSKDATFLTIEPGLTGEPGTVSFESVRHPGHFLRHNGYRVKMHRVDGSELFRNDSTYKQVQGRYATRGLEGSSFESVNYKGHYIRHCSHNLWIDNNKLSNRECDPNDEVFRKDVTYFVRDALVNRLK